MNGKHIKTLRVPILVVVAVLCGLILTTFTYAQNKQIKKLVGEWEMSTKGNPDNKRLIAFVISGGEITGTYTTESGEKLPVTSIAFADGKYSFRVTGAELVFQDFKFVGRKLEGVKHRTAAEKGRSVPEVVQMVKKTNR